MCLCASACPVCPVCVPAPPGVFLPVSCFGMSDWSNVWNTQRVINTGCSMEAPSRSTQIATRYCGFHFTLPSHKGYMYSQDSPTFLRPRGVDGGVTATGVLSRQRGNLITIVNTR